MRLDGEIESVGVGCTESVYRDWYGSLWVASPGVCGPVCALKVNE